MGPTAPCSGDGPTVLPGAAASFASCNNGVFTVVLVWPPLRLEETPKLPMAHLGHSPCHFKENHWFDPKGRCPGAFWIILWAAVGGGDVRLPEV